MRHFRNSTRSAALAALVVLCGAGAAASAPESDVAQARRTWAERHVALVCRPLEERGLVRQAQRCHQDAARAARSSVSDATGSIGAIPEPEATQVSKPRCAGISCLQMFSSLGVGF